MKTREKPETWQCPGAFNTVCTEPEDFAVNCGCEGELWMSPDCKQVSICSAVSSDPGSFEGLTTTCARNEIAWVDLPGGNPFEYGCQGTCVKSIEFDFVICILHSHPVRNGHHPAHLPRPVPLRLR